MNEKQSKKVRKETRKLYENELRGYRSLPFYKRAMWAWKILFRLGA